MDAIRNIQWTPRNKAILVGFVAIVIASIIMIACSFQYVEWDQYALKRNTASNTVDYGTVYENGRFFWGLGYSPVTFGRTMVTVDFSGTNSIVIFSEGGLELQISCSFQYAVIKDELPTLYRNYGTTYPKQLQSIALSILKNIAPTFTLEQYYNNRDLIRESMFTALKDGLKEKINVQVYHFQLNYIQLPDTVISKLLRISVQNLTNIEAQYIQQAAVTRQETANMAQAILANATVVNQTAVAQASFIVQQANAQAFTVQQTAKKDGLALLYSALSLNTSSLQLSYIYTTQLAQSGSSVNMFVDVNSVIIPQH